MGFKSVHLPCPCNKSSDAYAIDELGHGFCFSCAKFFPNNEEENMEDDKFTYQYLDWRGISAATFQKYKASFKINSAGEPVAVAFPYGDDARKVRSYSKKEFFAQGNMKDATLFGKDIFPSGSAEAIILTEGELDALSAHQMTKFPAVSVRGATSAFKDCAANLEYLNGFAKVYLAFDNDEPGKEATRRVAGLLGNRAYHVRLSGRDKDANDFLQRGAGDEFRNVVFYSRRFIPEEIVSSFAEVGRILSEAKKAPVVEYPFKRLQEMTYGIGRGVTLVTAQEGQGKTEIIRAIEAHILRTTDLNIGLIHLEESQRRSIQGLAGYALGIPTHLPDSTASTADVEEGFKRIAGRDERVHIINYFDGEDPNRALDLIRFLAAKCECKVIFLDHISQLVSALDDQDERKKLDYFATRLEQMTQELDFALILISHVNDEGKTRGSRYIGKVASVRIDLARDHLNADPIVRNTTNLVVSKNRDGATTGPAGSVYFDRDTFMIRDFDPEEFNVEQFIPGEAKAA